MCFLPSCSNTNTPRFEVVVAVQTVLKRLASKIAAFFFKRDGGAFSADSLPATDGQVMLQNAYLVWCLSNQPKVIGFGCNHASVLIHVLKVIFVRFGCERRCSLFVLCVTRCCVILLNLRYIFHKTILLLFLRSQCLILNCPGITLASVQCNVYAQSSWPIIF